MHLFKLTIATHASPRERETTTSQGPFIVAARDAAYARLLVGLNYSIATLRRLNAKSPLQIWDEAGPNECIRLKGLKEDAVRQSLVVAGTDIALWCVDQSVLKDGRKVMARMVWWPCRDSDQCPV